jgi:hypothetical protein
MSDPGPLIVPVDVKAMVVNHAAMNFVRSGMNYDALTSFGDAAPPPFKDDAGDAFAGNPANHGIYLMWTLPKALRHGTQQPGGRFTFPLVPNRWLAVRLMRAAGAKSDASPSAAAWVVQSDDLINGTSAYVDPNAATLTPTRIGSKHVIRSDAPWNEPSPTKPFLTAVAESNPAFAAYQPFNENVFSLFDDLSLNNDPTQKCPAATLSYFVFGWYAQPGADILADWTAGSKGHDFTNFIAKLRWSVTGTPGDVTTPPYTGAGTHISIYHGGAFAVQWDPSPAAAPASPKDDIRPQVALGNTGIDAVLAFAHAAFVAKPPANLTADEATQLLGAFQYSLLPMLGTPGTDALVEQTIRTNWFGSAEAGMRWTIVDAETKPGDLPAPPPGVHALAAEAAWLGDLNDAQERISEKLRHLGSKQRQLFELWWKKGNATLVYQQSGAWPFGTSSDQFDAAIAQHTTDVRGLISDLNADAANVPVASATVTLADAIANFAKSKNLAPSRVLKRVSEPRFWAPSDPVVVISNTAHTLAMDHDTALRCRWTSELVSGINVTAGTAVTVGWAQLAAAQPSVNWTNLPPLASALFNEFFLLDPANAGLIARVLGQNLSAADLATLAASMASPQVTGGTIAPDILAAYPWNQPWQPIYLDWNVQYYPIPFQQSDGTPNWTFDGLDYNLTTNAALPNATHEMTGRMVLTPKPAFDFKSRITQFVRDYPDSAATEELKAVNDLMSTVNGWDFLSQALGGVNTSLSGRKPLPTANPDADLLPDGGSLRDLVGDQARHPPDPINARRPRNRRIPPSTFEGMRGGQFYINQLTIVDVFGQTLEIVRPPMPPPGHPYPIDLDNLVFHPLLGDGLPPTRPVDTVEPLRFAQIPPRLLQPARLNFRFAPGNNGGPILGWILPNHLDSGISVYGPDGTGYGELRLGVDENGDPVVIWDAAPGSPYPDDLPGPSPDLPELENILATLKARGATALGEFLQAVDETLWSIDPLGSRSDAFLSVLTGRPLAIVRCALSFELQSEALRDSDWPQTFVAPPPDPLFLRYQFPVRLGDLGYRQDGLIGYFTEGLYDVFNNIHTPERSTGDPPASGYLNPIAPDNYVNLKFATNGPGDPATLILIMDPRASVHAQCGILPMKDITLPASWVDDALAQIAVTFRTGPVLAGQQKVKPPGADADVPGLLWPSPAERHGTWTWVERDASGKWPDMPLAPVDASAKFPAVAPTLRDGVLKLRGGLGA